MTGNKFFSQVYKMSTFLTVTSINFFANSAVIVTFVPSCQHAFHQASIKQTLGKNIFSAESFICTELSRAKSFTTLLNHKTLAICQNWKFLKLASTKSHLFSSFLLCPWFFLLKGAPSCGVHQKIDHRNTVNCIENQKLVMWPKLKWMNKEKYSTEIKGQLAMDKNKMSWTVKPWTSKTHLTI